MALTSCNPERKHPGGKRILGAVHRFIVITEKSTALE